MSDDVKLLDETMSMMNKYKDDGLLNVSGQGEERPSNMPDFLHNLNVLGYTGKIFFLKRGSISSNSAGELTDIYSFLRSKCNEDK